MKTPIKGSLYIIASAFFFGTYGVWSKMMAGVFDDFFQGWTRSAEYSSFWQQHSPISRK